MPVEQAILDALHKVPVERWQEVLHMVEAMQSPVAHAGEPGRIPTAADWLKSGLVGLWADRTDIADNHQFARQLRKQASRRVRGKSDDAGH